jgi:hypothetical protein
MMSSDADGFLRENWRLLATETHLRDFASLSERNMAGEIEWHWLRMD